MFGCLSIIEFNQFTRKTNASNDQVRIVSMSVLEYVCGVFVFVSRKMSDKRHSECFWKCFIVYIKEYFLGMFK